MCARNYKPCSVFRLEGGDFDFARADRRGVMLTGAVLQAKGSISRRRVAPFLALLFARESLP
jgi:hypothetical protein